MNHFLPWWRLVLAKRAHGVTDVQIEPDSSGSWKREEGGEKIFFGATAVSTCFATPESESLLRCIAHAGVLGEGYAPSRSDILSGTLRFRSSKLYEKVTTVLKKLTPESANRRVEKDARDSEGTAGVLCGLAKLTDLRPVIAIDSREQEPLTFTRLGSVRSTLYSGDYSIFGLEDSFAVERKSLDDIANCCMGSNRDRFEHELHRLRGYRFKRLLIVGSREDIAAGHYHSRIIPKAILATLGTFEIRYDLPVAFAATPEVAAREIERWAFYYCREVLKLAHAVSQSLCQLQK